MSVFRPKGSTTWYYDFWFEGFRHKASCKTESKAEADAIEAAVKTRLRREHFFGAPKKKPTMTLAECFGRYWDERGQHVAEATSEWGRLQVLTEALDGDTALGDIDDNRIALAVARIRGRTVGSGKARKLIANGTVNRYTECLRRAWRRAAKIWKVEVGAEPLWKDHLLDEASERVRDLTPADEARLLAALRPDYRPMVRFALMAGMRLGNIQRLTWKQVDFSGSAITIRLKSKSAGGRPHTVPMTGAMRDLLSEEKGNHPIYVFTYECARPRTGAAGSWEKGKRYPFTRDGWRKPWVAALRAAGIEDFRFHDTRHTAATRTLRASGNLKAVSKMLGHTDIMTTARYAHALTGDVLAAMEAAQSHGSPTAAPAKGSENTGNHMRKQRGAA